MKATTAITATTAPSIPESIAGPSGSVGNSGKIMNKPLIEKLQSKYASSEFTKLASEGKFEAAANSAAQMAMWGLWAELRNAACLSSDDAARNEWLSADKARRAAKFGKKN